ncbi:hypothetical protein SISSUDRAFT_1048569 [Sistotremastrum suecicum HHB10207 ss-3]|uniref:Uncharacterized protein n=1 Tax=Sistotremastrum suecicum HHB10207 ss-3 TaxID=1314776 RepID=A0A166CE54_9AGAM|nr:hypothetical protein SISSUDRAFT_1048569 [Sistotremastrum suecicum HHB10207 ss-3]
MFITPFQIQASALLFPLLLKFSAHTASAWPVNMRRDVDPSLVPPFGISPGVNPDGTGNCDGTTGPDGKPILIPCACPPSESDFLAALNANVAAGHATNNPPVALSFPTDSSKGSQLARIEACIITLQNLHGPGVGCPAASTTFVAQQSAIQNSPGRRSPSPSISHNGSTPELKARLNPNSQSSSSKLRPESLSVSKSKRAQKERTNTKRDVSDSEIAALAPALGFTAGINPTGTGNCDGAVNGADGKPIPVPCSCPPSQDVYISALQANVHAGHATNNPPVSINFPTDSSTASQAARVEAAIITMQNLNGPGVGCPVVSTTLGEQQQALQG